MSVDAQDLLNRALLLEEAVSHFIVRPTADPSQQGIAGFVFDIMDTERVTLRSEITDHYIEENVAIQDHIALHAEMITLRGFIGELNDIPPFSLTAIADTIPRLTLLDEYIPGFTAQATQVYNALSLVQALAGNALQQAQTLYGIFTQKSITATRQQNAFNYFYSLWNTRQIFSVETPWTIFENMAIDNVEPVQNGDTNMVTDFNITFKKIRTIQTLVTRPSQVASARAADLVAAVANKGKSVGQVSALSNLTNSFRFGG